MWCCSKKNSETPRTVHILLGYFFVLNFALATGFLGIPYTFFYSGFLAAIPTLLLAAFITWLTSVWLLEVMARAQALESYKLNEDHVKSTSNGTEMKDMQSSESVGADRQQPVFEITEARKFEIVELSEMFVGKWFKYVYLIVIIFYGFLTCWSFATVAGSAWATNIPYGIGALRVCQHNAFHHRILPLSGCLYSYYFSLFLFGVVVVILSILDLTEQIIVQVILGLLRYLTIGAMIIFCIVKLSEGGDACEEYSTLLPNATTTNKTAKASYHDLYNYSTQHISFEEIAVKFDALGWIISISVFVLAFMLHSGLSSLTHPIRQKKYLHWMLLINFSTAFILLLSIGVIISLWFKAGTQETVTLNWGFYSRPGNSPQLRALSYYIVLFPSLDVISAYPLTVHCIANNIYMIATGKDTSKNHRWRFDWLLRVFLRLLTALLPILAAFGVANLIYVLKYTGVAGFGVCFLFPTLLQLRSTTVCIKKFGSGTKLNLSAKAEDETNTAASEIPEEKSLKPESSSSSENGNKVDNEKSSLLEEKSSKPDKHQFYMTPYSNVVLSNPIFVGIIGIVEVCLFILAFAGLFIQPSKMSCEEI